MLRKFILNLLENIDKDKFKYIAFGKDQACIKII